MPAYPGSPGPHAQLSSFSITAAPILAESERIVYRKRSVHRVMDHWREGLTPNKHKE